ncbi:MAG: hypothetical protein JW938_06845 [Candidatus Omnitrophica bacterium]|nr:hypothetical protein [Candidatus Omnitrophota bacterium]
MKKRTILLRIGVSLFCCFILNMSVACALTTLTHEYQPVEFSIGSDPIELWTPWVPLFNQILLRLKLGLTLSAGSIIIKNPVKVTVEYDPNEAQGGKTLHLKFKAEPRPASYNTFQSDFGIYLPNKIQLGLANMVGIGSLTPWLNVPYDFWQLCGHVPKVGEHIANASQQIGVNMASKEALPLGTSKSYHDARDLISFNLADAFIKDSDKNKVGEDIANAIPGKTAILGTISAVTGKSSADSKKFLIEKCAGILPGFVGKLATVSISGDPSYTVEGVNICLNVRFSLQTASGGVKGSGTYPIYFTSTSQTKEIAFGLTPFIETGDKVKIVIEKITYEFKLSQGLQFMCGLSLLPSPAENYTKVLRYTQAVRDTAAEKTFEIPVEKSTSAMQLMMGHPGYTSAQIKFASPYIALKSSVDVFKGTTSAANKVKTVRESEYKTSHNIVITDLLPKTNYNFIVNAADQSGGQHAWGSPVAVKTLDEDKGLTYQESTGDFKFVGTPTATAGYNQTDGDYIDFTWTTSRNGSTMVYYSPSPDISINYIAAVKRTNGTVTQGWVTSDDTPLELVSSHSIRVKGLDPGIKYYYGLRSMFYKNDDLNDNLLAKIGRTGNVSTLTPPPPPSVTVKAQGPNNTALAGAIILIKKTNDASFSSTAITGTNGITPEIILDKGSNYTFSLKDHPAYQDITSSALTVGANASGALSMVTMNLTKKPSPGGIVCNEQGAPIQGASITVGTKTAQTSSTGQYTVEGLSKGTPTVNVTKNGYLNGSVKGAVDTYGIFTAPPCVLVSQTATLAITIKDGAGAAVNGASIAIKEGSTSLGTVTTNSSGQATFTKTYTNTQSHTVTLTVTPPSNSPLMASNETATIAAGETTEADIICNADIYGPVITDVAVTQTGEKALQVTFAVDETNAQSCVQYVDPKGNITTTPWNTNRTVTIQGNTLSHGIYKIKVKAKDGINNITETSETQKILFGGAEWHFWALDVGTTSAHLTWSKFPYSTGFGKYVITINGDTKDITSVSTTKYDLSGLSTMTDYSATITAVSSQGTLLTTPGTVSFRTFSLPPEPRIETETTVVRLGDTLRIDLFVYDPDSDIQNIYAEIKSTNGKQQVLVNNEKPNSQEYSSTHTGKFEKAGDYKIALDAHDDGRIVSAERNITVK